MSISPISNSSAKKLDVPPPTQSVSHNIATKGFAQGHHIQQHPTPQSFLQSSAEELSIGIASRLGRNASKRTSTKDDDESISSRIIDDLHESDAEGLLQKFTPPQRDILERLLQQHLKDAKDPQQLLQELKRSFPDSADQYIALQSLKLKMLSLLNRSSNLLNMEDFDKYLKTVNLINEELFVLMDEKTIEIRSALNTAEAIKEFSGKMAVSSEVLRQFYRGTVLRYKTPKELFKYIIEKFGADKLDESMDFLSKSVSTDMQTLHSSISKNQLGTIISDLYNLASLKHVNRQVKILVGQVKKHFQCGAKTSNQEVMVSVLEMTEKQWLSKIDIDKYLKIFQAEKTKAVIPILTRTKEIFRLLPNPIYADPKIRDKLMTALSEAVNGYAIQELRDS